MGSKIALKNAQDQEFSINHNDNAGAISINSSDISLKSQTESEIAPYNKGFKNYIINGNFDIWQRGTSGFSGQNYGADRWIGSNGVESYSRQNVDSLGGYYARISRTTASSSSLLLVQRIEQSNVKDLAGKIMTLSFYTRQTVGAVLPINLYIYTPTLSDIYTSVVLQQTINALSNPTATFQKVSVSFTVSSIMALNGFAISIGNLNSGTASIDVHQVQLEEGSVATPFESRPQGLELSLCQRYYQTWLGFLDTYNMTNSNVRIAVPFRVSMRTNPTIAIISNTSIGVNSVATSISGNQEFILTGISASTAHSTLSASGIASAEL